MISKRNAIKNVKTITTLRKLLQTLSIVIIQL